MRTFLAFVLMLAQGCVAFAANPSFQSFNANQFATNNARVALKDSLLVTNLVNHGEMTSDSTATGSEFFGDGGSFGYRITPPTMSGFINFIPDTSAQTGVPYHTAIGTNLYESHLPLIWTNSAGTIQASSTVADGSSAIAFSFNSSNTLADVDAKLAVVKNNGTNRFTISAGGRVEILGNASDQILHLAENSGSTLTIGGTSGYNQHYSDGAEVTEYIFGETPYLVFTTATGLKPIIFDPNLDQETKRFYLSTPATQSSGYIFEIANNYTNQFSVDFLGGLTTGLPSGATNAQPFKIGSEANAVGLVLVATNYIQIELNGIAYKLGLVK